MSCSSASVNQVNDNLSDSKSAYRLTNIGKGLNTTYELQPAGVRGQTIAVNSRVLFADIFKSIRSKCGFEKKDLVETKLVSRKIPIFYEVWVFHDMLSEYKNKQSAISVVLKQYPNGGGVDISLPSECHPKPMRMTFI